MEAPNRIDVQMPVACIAYMHPVYTYILVSNIWSTFLWWHRTELKI